MDDSGGDTEEQGECDPHFADRVTEIQRGYVVRVFTMELKYMALTFGPQFLLFVLFL